MGDHTTSPTWVRWRILALLFAFSFMSWFNRVSMQAAGDMYIIEHYGLSPAQFGLLITAFFLAYTVFMTPGGGLIDRRGPKFALLLMGIGSGLFGLLTGLPGFLFTETVLVFGSLLVIRSLMGAFSAPIYPASGRIVAHWIPLRQRSLCNGIVVCAAILGNACTYPVFGRLIDSFGWPIAFVISGTVTASLALAWMLYATDYPAEHPATNSLERELIREGDPLQYLLQPEMQPVDRATETAIREGEAPADPIAPRIISSASETRPSDAALPLEQRITAPLQSPWYTLLRNRSLILLTLSYAAVGYFEYASFFSLPRYLKVVGTFSKDEWRNSVGIIMLAMAVSMPTGGWLADRLQRVLGRRWGRAVVPSAGMALSAVFLVVGLGATNPTWIVFWFALAMAAHGTCEGPSWTTAIELGGRRGGTSAGIFNTGGNVLGALAPTITPWIGVEFGWTSGLGLASAICMTGAILWLWIDPAERVKEDVIALPT